MSFEDMKTLVDGHSDGAPLWCRAFYHGNLWHKAPAPHLSLAGEAFLTLHGHRFKAMSTAVYR